MRLKNITTQGVKITIDLNCDTSYVPANILKLIFNRLFLIPFFYLMPYKFGTFFLTKSSQSAYDIYKYAKSSQALEVLYNFDGKFNFSNHYFDSVATYVYQHNFLNAKAVRNRFKMVRKEVRDCIVRIYNRKRGRVNIFSIASGSARVIIEVMAELKKEGIPTYGKLLDLSEGALALSKKIAADYGVYDDIQWCHDKASNFENYCNGWKPDLIEMVGFMDYLNQDKAISLVSKIYNVLSEDGYFITCNIRDNYERFFVTKILNWPMIYRSEDELADVLLKGGFPKDDVQLIYEPYQIHGIAVAKK